MRQRKSKGFTLIELLIVVAIIAILAAIAVPNFLEAQVRSKVSRAKTDMRTIATALEAYFVDNNTYIGSGSPTNAANYRYLTVNCSLSSTAPTGAWGTGTSPGGALERITFQTYRPQLVDGRAQSITTPVAYLTSLPSEPFADTKGCTFGYWNTLDAGWIAWSYGPDTDEKTGNGQLQSYIWQRNGGAYPDYPTFISQNSVYNPYQSNPTVALRTGNFNGLAFTYDATNGTNSAGDIWRTHE